MITAPSNNTYIPESLFEPGMKIKGFTLIEKLIDGKEVDKNGVPIRNLRGNLWWAKKNRGKKKVMVCISGMRPSDL